MNMKTIKDAYEDLKGDLKNTFMHGGGESTLSYSPSDNKYYTGSRTTSNRDFHYICTVEEFNNYKPEAAQENEAVKNPKHYQTIEGYESIEVIACSLTAEQWKGFCLGNILKYRIRAGKKDLLQQDIDKANNYEVLHEKYQHLCREDK